MDKNWFIPDMSDYGKQVAKLLSNAAFSTALQNSLSEAFRTGMPDMTSYAREIMKLDTRAIADAFQQMVKDTAVSPTTAYLNEITRQWSDWEYQNMTVQLADSAKKVLEALPLKEFADRPGIPVDEVQEALSGIKSVLPDEAAKLVDDKVEEAQTEDKKISNSDWIAIIGIIVTILLFIVGQCSSAEHEQKEEAAWSALAEYQKESVELQKQDITLKQEILDHLNSQPSDLTREDIESESANEHDNHVVDLVDPQNHPDDQDAVQGPLQEQPDAED